jgi:hypothetical protein
MDDDYEKMKLQLEVERLKKEKEQTHNATTVFIFLAIWILPLVGMSLIQGDNPPPAVGPISMFGIWFLGVPLCALIYRIMNK